MLIRALLAAAFAAAAASVAAQATAPAPAASAAPAAPRAVADVPALYRQHCASCHGEQRLGGMGPALLPESLERLRPAEALKVITHGRAATQMNGFAAELSGDDIAALARWIYTPVEPRPSWSESDIRAKRRRARATCRPCPCGKPTR
jgi:mono/diheme cytochrome c family protein